MNIRRAAVAGSFYPNERAELKLMVEKFLASAKNFNLKPKCLIVPHAGYVYSGPVAAAGYKQLSNLEQKKWKVILLGPSHHNAFTGAVTAPFKAWETPLGYVKAEQLPQTELLALFADVHVPEHCLEVQLPFLQLALKEFLILPLLTGEVEPEKLAKELIPHIDDWTLLIVSSDLSHYHPYEKAKEIDAFANKIIPAIDLKNAEKIDACGKTAILTAMHIAKALKWRGHFLDYKNSGDTAGPKDQVVGYGAYAFTEV